MAMQAKYGHEFAAAPRILNRPGNKAGLSPKDPYREFM
jgi:hypothetical protein